MFFGNLFERGEFTTAGAGEKDVDLALFALDGFIEPERSDTCSEISPPTANMTKRIK